MRAALLLSALCVLSACEPPPETEPAPDAAPVVAAEEAAPEPAQAEPVPDDRGDVYEYGDLEVWDVTLTEGEFGVSEVTGTARHSQRGTASYVEVRVAVYDADGALLETTLANAADVPPDTDWKWTAVVTSEDVARVEVSGAEVM
jgi:hypothetical protein